MGSPSSPLLLSIQKSASELGNHQWRGSGHVDNAAKKMLIFQLFFEYVPFCKQAPEFADVDQVLAAIKTVIARFGAFISCIAQFHVRFASKAHQNPGDTVSFYSAPWHAAHSAQPGVQKVHFCTWHCSLVRITRQNLRWQTNRDGWAVASSISIHMFCPTITANTSAQI